MNANSVHRIEQFTVRVKDDGQQTTIAKEMEALGLESGNAYFHHLYQHRVGTPPVPAPQPQPTAAELLAKLTAIEQRLDQPPTSVPVDTKPHAEIAAIRVEHATHAAALRSQSGQFYAVLIFGAIALFAAFASLAAWRIQPPPAPITVAPATAK